MIVLGFALFRFIGVPFAKSCACDGSMQSPTKLIEVRALFTVARVLGKGLRGKFRAPQSVVGKCSRIEKAKTVDPSSRFVCTLHVFSDALFFHLLVDLKIAKREPTDLIESLSILARFP